MLNIEKYENELRKYGTYFALTKEGKLVTCEGLACKNCSFDGGCPIKRMNWLLEEYKEPILDDIEKEYLSSFIKPFKNRVNSISKISGDRIYYIEIRYDNDEPTYFPSFEENDNMYRGMVADKEYTLEELDL